MTVNHRHEGSIPSYPTNLFGYFENVIYICIPKLITMLAVGILIGIVLTLGVQKLGPAIGLWGKKQILGSEEADKL